MVLDSRDAGMCVETAHAGEVDVYDTQELLRRWFESLEVSETSSGNEGDGQEEQEEYYVRYLVGELTKRGVDVSVVMAYVYEGDNFYDGERMAEKLARMILPKKEKEEKGEEGEERVKWIRPISWFGAYGDKPVPNSMEEGLFG